MDGISSHPTGSPLFPLSVNAVPFALYELWGAADFVLQALLQQLGILLYSGKFFSRE